MCKYEEDMDKVAEEADAVEKAGETLPDNAVDAPKPEEPVARRRAAKKEATKPPAEEESFGPSFSSEQAPTQTSSTTDPKTGRRYSPPTADMARKGTFRMPSGLKVTNA